MIQASDLRHNIRFIIMRAAADDDMPTIEWCKQNGVNVNLLHGTYWKHKKKNNKVRYPNLLTCLELCDKCNATMDELLQSVQ